MMNIDWLTFLLKLLLVPTFIGIVSLSGRKWGPTVSGWLVGLPLTSGPVVFILALEQGNVFASATSQAIIMGIVSVFIFALVYSWAAMHRTWPLSLLAGLCVYFACTFFLEFISLPLLIGFALAIAVLLTSLLLMPQAGSDKVSQKSPRWEIPARMVSATALVFLITGVAQMLGPQLTGLLTPFPIYATILAVFTHRYAGGAQAVKLLRGVVAGSFTFAVFFLVISSTIIVWGIGLAFVCAIGVSLLTHAASFQFLRR